MSTRERAAVALAEADAEHEAAARAFRANPSADGAYKRFDIAFTKLLMARNLYVADRNAPDVESELLAKLHQAADAAHIKLMGDPIMSVPVICAICDGTNSHTRDCLITLARAM